DNEDIILTDLESTNGTRVNGNLVQIRRLRLGDCICVGRSLLLFGSNEEIAARLATMANSTRPPTVPGETPALMASGPATIRAQSTDQIGNNELEFDLNLKDQVTIANGDMYVGNRPLPPLPKKLSPAQAARIAEIFDFLHRGISFA